MWQQTETLFSFLHFCTNTQNILSDLFIRFTIYNLKTIHTFEQSVIFAVSNSGFIFSLLRRESTAMSAYQLNLRMWI